MDIKLGENWPEYVEKASSDYAHECDNHSQNDYIGHQVGMEHVINLFESVTRFEVIDKNGRSYVVRFKDAEMQFQDNFRTLKLFINDQHS